MVQFDWLVAKRIVLDGSRCVWRVCGGLCVMRTLTRMMLSLFVITSDSSNSVSSSCLLVYAEGKKCLFGFTHH